MLQFLKKSKAVLGINARNLDYIRPNNLRAAKRISDDKLRTKRVLRKAKIETPKLFGAIKSREDLKNFDFSGLPNSFVLKPNRGYAGGGIIVVFGKSKRGGWVTSSGVITENDLRRHIIDILDGNFSLQNVPDIAFFEQRVQITKLLKPYSYKGIPDVRVIVYNRVPVMSMLRLPTEESKGKGNVTMGAIGVGVDVSTGVTTTAIIRKTFSGWDKVIEYVPGTRQVLSGLKLPYWDEILQLAIRSQEISKLGYLGVDVAFDREEGPLVLELNARPGLSIQNANLAPLKDRLERVKGLKVKDAEHGVRIAKNLFGGSVKQEVEETTGRKVIGLTESVLVLGKGGKEIKLDAKIDTGADLTSVDVALAKKLGFGEAVTAYQGAGLWGNKTYDEVTGRFLKYDKHSEDIHKDLAGVRAVHSTSGSSLRPVVKLKIKIGGTEIVSKAVIGDRSGLKYQMILGNKDMKGFIVDPIKK